MSRVFRVNIEVGHMEGCQLPIEAAGAIVSVYVGSHTLRDALDRAEQQLREDRYRPIDAISVYELDLDVEDFDTEEEGYPNNADLEKIRDTMGLWYGPFYTFPYEPEAEDQSGGEQASDGKPDTAEA